MARANKFRIVTSIDTLYKNLLDIGLQIEPSKTQVIHFENKNFSRFETPIRIWDTNIKPKNSVKFLGIHLGKKFNLKKQIQESGDKVKRANSIFKYAQVKE